MAVPDLDALPPVPGRLLRRSPAGATAGVCVGGHGWFVLESSAGTTHVLDGEGRVLDGLPAPGAGADRLRRAAVDRHGRRVAVAGVDHVLIIDADGGSRRVAHPAWHRFVGGDVAFDPTAAGRDRLWLVAPRADVEGPVRPPAAGVVWLVDAATGEVLDRLDLDDGHPEGYTVLAVPDRGVVVNGAYGQDGSATWCLRTDGRSVEARALGPTGVAADVDGARGEILFMPHDAPDAEVRTWWDGAVVARFAGEPVFGSADEQAGEQGDGDGDGSGEPDGFDYSGAFLDDRSVAVLTRRGRVLVVDRATGLPRGRLVVEGDDPEADAVRQIEPGRLLLVGPAATLVAADPIG